MAPCREAAWVTGSSVDKVQRGQVVEMGDVGHDQIAALNDVLDYLPLGGNCSGSNCGISPFLHVLVPGSTVMPNAVSKLLTEANPCAVGQTPHIRCVICGASLGSLLFMISSKPLNRLPVHFASVI